jgi:hypothetical protein
MKKLFLYLAILFTSTTAFAQEPIGHMVVGLEVGADLTYLGSNRNAPMPVLQVEYPFGKFSAGIGVGYKRFRNDVTQVDFTGRVEPVIDGLKKSLGYFYEENSLTPAYWTVPLRLQYRLPCNCVYLHAGVSFDFLNEKAPQTSIYPRFTRPDLDENNPTRKGLRSALRSYELGAGFKLHSSDYFRIIMRPSAVWTENPDLDATDNMIPSLRITFGAQYAFVRYGGKF